jgi:hypothetical protein
MAFLAAVPAMFASLGSATAGMGSTIGAGLSTAAGAAGSVGGAAGGAAAAGSAAGGMSVGTALSAASAAAGLTGSVLGLTMKPKLPAAPQAPKPPDITSQFNNANTSMAAIKPGSILGGTYSPGSAGGPGATAGSTSYGKTVLGG